MALEGFTPVGQTLLWANRRAEVHDPLKRAQELAA